MTAKPADERDAEAAFDSVTYTTPFSAFRSASRCRCVLVRVLVWSNTTAPIISFARSATVIHVHRLRSPVLTSHTEAWWRTLTLWMNKSLFYFFLEVSRVPICIWIIYKGVARCRQTSDSNCCFHRYSIWCFMAKTGFISATARTQEENKGKVKQKNKKK